MSDTESTNKEKKKKKLSFILLSLGLSLMFAYGCVEITFRFLKTEDEQVIERYEKVHKRPVFYDKRLGIIFEPHKENEFSNGVDFHCISKTNRYGFLDRDFEQKKPDNTYRILFIGDSYLEASQVPIEKKVQVLVEKQLNQKGFSKKIQTMALGFSGMGTTNELVFYNRLGRKFEPDLVVLVFINNDFANNSPALHAMNEGWIPDRSPRYFFEFDHRHQDKLIVFDITHPMVRRNYIGIDLPKVPKPQKSFDDNLMAWSKFYPYFKSNMKEYLGVKEKVRVVENVLSKRMEKLRTIPFYNHKLEGWNYPADLDMNEMFACKTMPRVFNEALHLTSISIGTMKDIVENDGAKLLVVADHYLSINQAKHSFDREMFDKEKFNKLKRITDFYKLDCIDLYEAFKKKGSIKDATWRFDGHWNEKGHQWTAEAISEHIIKNNIIDLPRKSFLVR